MKLKKFLSGMALITSMMLMAGCGASGTVKNTEAENTGDNKPNVVVSIYPLKLIADEIAKDKIDVKCFVPDNASPHHFDPTAKDIEELTKSDAFIYNGLNMEDWLDKVKDTVDPSKTQLVNTTEGIKPLNKPLKDKTVLDPHAWLSLKNAEIQAGHIKDALEQVDEKNKDYYEDNYNEFKDKLENLYNEYKGKFDSVNNKKFVTGHAAFGYLCRDFGLEQKSVQDVFDQGEPTAKDLEDLTNYCKENNIKTVFSESLASPKISETLANEAGADVVPILTLESKENDDDYITSMKYNLDLIYKCVQAE